MKKLFIFIIGLSFININPIKSVKPQELLVIPEKILSIEQRVYNTYYKMGENLLKDNLITISPNDFANYATIVTYCESSFDTMSNKLGQQGIAQITTSTRKSCNIPDLLHLTIEDQIKHHETFLRKCSKKALRSIKSSIDFHALNFAPSRTFKSTLSKVTNKYLKALDFNKDNIITKDLAIFQKKENITFTKIYTRSISIKLQLIKKYYHYWASLRGNYTEVTPKRYLGLRGYNGFVQMKEVDGIKYAGEVWESYTLDGDRVNAIFRIPYEDTIDRRNSSHTINKDEIKDRPNYHTDGIVAWETGRMELLDRTQLNKRSLDLKYRINNLKEIFKGSNNVELKFGIQLYLRRLENPCHETSKTWKNYCKDNPQMQFEIVNMSNA